MTQPGQRLNLPDPTVTQQGRGVTGMEYKIIGTTLQAVIMELDPGETVYSESGGMSWMSGNITMNTGARSLCFGRAVVAEPQAVGSGEFRRQSALRR